MKRAIRRKFGTNICCTCDMLIILLLFSKTSKANRSLVGCWWDPHHNHWILSLFIPFLNDEPELVSVIVVVRLVSSNILVTFHSCLVMDFISVFHRIWQRLVTFSHQNNTKTLPTFSWSAATFCHLLLQYPAGLTEAVLLTELESKWRLYLRRGENAGKLRQVLTSLQLSSGDVLLGEITTRNSEDSGR